MAVEKQHLKHGKALCGNVFARFVETFNALVDFMCNVKGDADAKNGEGHITFDRSNPAHPVIRCDGCCGSAASEPGKEDPEEEDRCVTSLNDLTGALNVIGGEGILVEVVGSNTIKISYVEGKPPDDKDPCEHPGGDGVPADYGGGVPADDDGHAGDPCNCD